MKKTLIALAAIAAVGAASAQVTVYGKLDVGVSNTSAGGTVVGVNQWENSRFGIKAEQEVSKGLKAMVNLEGKLSTDTGTMAGFDRVATVGLTGGFGTLTMGTQWTPYDNATWTADALEYNGFTPFAGGFWNYDNGNNTTYYGNAKNSIQYATPDMNGFQAIILTAPNVPVGGTTLYTSYSGIGLNYAKGPFVVNFATQSYNATAAAPTVNTWVLALNYNVGAANLYGGFNSASDGPKTETGYTFGVKVPMGKDSVSVGYANDKKSVGGVDTTKGAWGAQYIKSLNAATVAYFGIQSVDSVNKTAAGLRINF
jgi:predicted porin